MLWHPITGGGSCRTGTDVASLLTLLRSKKGKFGLSPTQIFEVFEPPHAILYTRYPLIFSLRDHLSVNDFKVHYRTQIHELSHFFSTSIYSRKRQPPLEATAFRQLY